MGDTTLNFNIRANSSQAVSELKKTQDAIKGVGDAAKESAAVTEKASDQITTSVGKAGSSAGKTKSAITDVGDAAVVAGKKGTDAGKTIADGMADVEDAAKKAKEQTKGLGDESETTGKKGKTLAELFMVQWSEVAQSLQLVSGTLKGVFDSTIEVANRMQTGSASLTGIAAKLGVDAKTANDAAKMLASDGMMSMADASVSLKTLLASGLNIDTATSLLQNMKDAAVENRQANYGLSDSLRVFAEGFKNEMSQATDAAGITKNYAAALADMFKAIKEGRQPMDQLSEFVGEAAAKQAVLAVKTAKSSDALDDQTRRVLAAAGMQKELLLFRGRALANADSLAVVEQKLTNAYEASQAAIGNGLLPVKKELLKVLTALVPILETFGNWFAELSPTVRTAVVVVGGLVVGITALGSQVAILMPGILAFKTLIWSSTEATTLLGDASAVTAGKMGLMGKALTAGGVLAALAAFVYAVKESASAVETCADANTSLAEKVKSTDSIWAHFMAVLAGPVGMINQLIGKFYQAKQMLAMWQSGSSLADIAAAFDPNQDTTGVMDAALKEGGKVVPPPPPPAKPAPSAAVAKMSDEIKKLVESFKDAQKGPTDLAAALAVLSAQGATTTQMARVFGDQLLKLDAANELGTVSSNTLVRAVIAQAYSMDVEKTAGEATTKAFNDYAESVDKLNQEVSKMSPAERSMTEAIVANLMHTAALEGETLTWKDAMEQATKQAQALNEKVKENHPTLVLQNALMTQSGQSYDAVQAAMARVGLATDAQIKLRDKDMRNLGESMDLLAAAYDAGELSASDWGDAQLSAIDQVLKGMGYLPPELLTNLQFMVTSTDAEMRGKAWPIFASVIDSMKAKGQELPPEMQMALAEVTLSTDEEMRGKALPIWDDMIEKMKAKGQELPPWMAEVNKQILKNQEDAAFSKQFQDSWDQAWKGLGEGISNAIVQWKGFWQSLKDTCKTFVSSILQGIIGPFFGEITKGISGLVSGQGGGFNFGGALGGIKSLFGLGAKTAGAAAGAAEASAAAFGAPLLGGTAVGGGMMASLGALMTNPITIAAAVAAAIGIIGYKYINNPNRKASLEATRDYGANISKNEFEDWTKTVGFSSSSQYKGIRADLLASPKLIQELLLPAAKEAGTVSTLIEKFSHVSFLGKDYDFSANLQKAIDTGVWEDLNKQWADLFSGSKALTDAMPDFATKLAAVGQTAQQVADSNFAALGARLQTSLALFQQTGYMSDKLQKAITGAGMSADAFISQRKEVKDLTAFQTELGGLGTSLQGLLPQKATADSVLGDYLKTGAISEGMAAKIQAQGGNLEVFKAFSAYIEQATAAGKTIEEFTAGNAEAQAAAVELMDEVAGLQGTLAAKIEQMTSKFSEAIDKLIAQLAKMSDSGAGAAATPPAVVDFGDAGGDTGVNDAGIPAMARGGRIRSSGLALVHAGERVVPAGRSSGSGSAPQITLTIAPSFVVQSRSEDLAATVRTDVAPEIMRLLQSNVAGIREQLAQMMSQTQTASMTV